MDLSFTVEYETFREEVRSFLAEHWDASAPPISPRDTERAPPFRALAIECGYLARTIPRDYGGSEQTPDPLKTAVIREEFRKVGAPVDIIPPAAQLIATLVAHGSEEQKRRFLPPAVTGAERWCQGYSEPGAGSDLAAVSTTAELVGDEWVINGQKIWTSYATDADMIYMLCRTEPEAGKHAGISFLLVDVDQPGIQVSPLQGITGDSHFNQVFFDDARAPADRVVGRRGEGWVVSRATLQAERDSVGTAAEAIDEFEELVDLARVSRVLGAPALENPDIRQRMVEIEAFVLSHAYSSYRQLTCDARGESSGLLGTMNKLVGTDIKTRAGWIALELLGDGQLAAPKRQEQFVPSEMGWIARFYRYLGLRIGGGTSNIQRNIIGEHGLGLPRDFALQKKGKRS